MSRFQFKRLVIIQAVIVLLGIAPVVGAGVVVWMKHQQYQSELADLSPRYARLLGLVNHRADLQKLGDQVNEALSRLTYPASQDIAKAGNDAQQRIRSLLTDSHLEVASIQVLPAKEEGQFNRVTISVRVEGDLVAVQSALDKLKAMTPAVLVDSMSLQTIGAARPASIQRLAGQFSLSIFRVKS